VSRGKSIGEAHLRTDDLALEEESIPLLVVDLGGKKETGGQNR
jgi:hypothetical protein